MSLLMPTPPSFTVKIRGIADIDPFYGLTQIRMRCFGQQVIVIGHQAICMNLYLIAFHRLADIFQKLFAVPVTSKYVRSGISAMHYVIESTWVFYS